MTQTKEEQQEKARQRNEDAERNARFADTVRGRPLSEGEGHVIRADWDSGTFDPSDRYRRVFVRFNYRTRRDEWSYGPVPADLADDYDPAKWPKLPDGRSACMYPAEAKRLGIPLVKVGTVLEAVAVPVQAPRRRIVLPPITA